MASPITVYRQLLREVRRQNNGQFVPQLKSLYRDNRTITDAARLQQLNRNAENVLTYLRSARQHKELRDAYSAIVLEQKKKIELSANRVGLQLPKEYDPNSNATDRVMDAFHKS